MSGSGAADDDTNKTSRIVEGIRVSTMAGGSGNEPANLQRAIAGSGLSLVTDPVALLLGLASDWDRSFQSEPESPPPEDSDRLFWDFDGTRRGGPYHPGVTSTAIDIPQPASTRSGDIFPGAIIAPAASLVPSPTQATEVDTPVGQAETIGVPAIADANGSGILSQTEIFLPARINSGQESTPYVTEATEPDTPCGEGTNPYATGATEEATPLGQEEDDWRFKALCYTGPEVSSSSRIPEAGGFPTGRATRESQAEPRSATSVQPAPRREVQSMVLPWKLRTNPGSRLTTMGNGRQQRASFKNARSSAAIAQSSLLATERDTPVHGSDVPVLPWTLRPRNLAMRGHVTRGRSVLVAGTSVLSQLPPQPQPINEGAAGCGIGDGLRIAPSEKSCVAETDLSLLAGGEPNAATRVPTDEDSCAGGAVSARHLQPSIWDGNSLTTSMREMIVLRPGASRKRKAGEQPATPQWPCVTVRTQWACGHNVYSGVTHDQRCPSQGHFGLIFIAPIPGRVLCPEPTTRIVLSTSVCIQCSRTPTGGRSELVGGWVSDLMGSKRVRR